MKPVSFALAALAALLFTVACSKAPATEQAPPAPDPIELALAKLPDPAEPPPAADVGPAEPAPSPEEMAAFHAPVPK
jgi:hypothetical protein